MQALEDEVARAEAGRVEAVRAMEDAAGGAEEVRRRLEEEVARAEEGKGEALRAAAEQVGGVACCGAKGYHATRLGDSTAC